MKFRSAFVLVLMAVVITIAQAKTAFSQESWDLWEKLFAAENINWKLIKDKKGIKVYSHPVEISTVNAFKGVMTLETDVSSLAALILDAESYTKWMRVTDVSEYVKKISETEYYRYTVNKIKWPVKPRDCSAYMKGFYYPETDAVMIRFKHKPDFVPRNKKYVRIPIIIGHYLITPKPDDTVELIFEAVVETGGWVPNWIINFYLADIPHGTFNSIQKIMPLTQYKEKKYNFTKDFEVIN